MNGCEYCKHYWNNGKGDENCEIKGWDLNSVGCSYYDDRRISIIAPQEFQKPKTNADRIRSMSDEELAIWLSENTNRNSATGWILWLKQEAADKDGIE